MLQLILTNNYRKSSESTENLPKECFQEYELKTFFTVFWQFLTVLKMFRTFFRAFRKIFWIFYCKFSQNVVFGVFPLFTECLSEHSKQLNCLNLVAGLRMGIYEDHQIHTKTGSWPIRLQYSQSNLRTNRTAYNKLKYFIANDIYSSQTTVNKVFKVLSISSSAKLRSTVRIFGSASQSIRLQIKLVTWWVLPITVRESRSETDIVC